MAAVVEPIARNGYGRQTAAAGTGSLQVTALYSLTDLDPNATMMAQPGDYILALIHYASTTAPGTTPPTITGPETMTQLGTTQTIAAGRYAAVFGGFVDRYLDDDVLTFTAPATISIHFSNAQIYRGVDPTTPIDVTTTTTVTSGTSHASPSITPTTDGARVVVILAASNDDGAGGSTFGAAPTGWHNDLNGGTATGVDGSNQYLGKIISPAAATTVTQTSGASVAAAVFSIALRPASATSGIDEIYVGRSASMIVTNTVSGWTKTPTLPPVNPNRLAPTSTDMLVVCAHYTDGSAVTVSNDSAWTAISASAPWVYVAPYDPAIVFPTFTAPATIDRFWAFVFIIRDVDPNDMGDVIAGTTGTSTTITWPTATPTLDDAIVMRVAYLNDDQPNPNGAPTAGSYVIGNTTGWNTTTGLDCGTLVTLEALTGGAGVALGAATATVDASVAFTSQTIVFNRAPEIVQLVSAVDAGAIVVGTTLEATGAGQFIESTVDVGSVVVSTRLVSRRRQPRPRREYIWVKDLSGNTAGVIR